jgi:hypothetical protein
MEDRREHRRVSVSNGLLLEGAVNKHPIKVKNISLGGCYVETSIEVKIGVLQVIELPIPDAGMVFFSGKVVHIEPGLGFGMEFSYMPESKRAVLQGIIDSLL